jgi:hypothetical protein
LDHPVAQKVPLAPKVKKVKLDLLAPRVSKAPQDHKALLVLTPRYQGLKDLLAHKASKVKLDLLVQPVHKAKKVSQEMRQPT